MTARPYTLKSFERLENDARSNTSFGGGSGGLRVIHRQLGGRPSWSGGLSIRIVVKGFGQK